MKIATVIARVLFGLAFLASGIIGISQRVKLTMSPSDATTMSELMMNH